MDNILFLDITGWMLLFCIAGIFGLFLYGAWQNEQNKIKIKDGYSVKKYMKPTGLNILFQGFFGILTVFLLHELSDKILDFSGMHETGIGHNVMATASGMFGGQFWAFILEKGRMFLNWRDNEIAHTEKPELDLENPLKKMIKIK